MLTVGDLRGALFLVQDQDMTVRDLRHLLFDVEDQGAPAVTVLLKLRREKA